MTYQRRVANSKAKRKVAFPKVWPTMVQVELLDEGEQPQRATRDEGGAEEPPHHGFYQMAHERVPAMHLNLPFILDDLKTETSQKQLSTARNIMKSVNQQFLPSLDKATHIEFLLSPLDEGLSGGFVGLDASRPWLLYWCTNALSLLGEDVGIYNDRVISSLKPLQHPGGGFGGGNGQAPHVAAAYASILTLAITSYHASRGLPENERLAVYADSFAWIDRGKLLQWIRKIKLPSGGFKVNEGGEEDVRAGYCALVVLALLGYDDEDLRGDPSLGDLPLLGGVAEYFKSCQTWEGGVGAKPHAEAHGGYAFCVLAALCLLGDPEEALSKNLDLNRLVSWLSARQYAPEGGFSGRTNKLVDGCYSTWVGGCWSLVEAAANAAESRKMSTRINVGDLWSRKALIRYILTCCQGPNGGLRDKPGMRPDYYHSNYVLLGLSAAQHYYYYDDSFAQSPVITKSPFRHGYRWKSSKNVPKPTGNDGAGGGWLEGLVSDEGDRVGVQHPLFNIPLGAETQLQSWWEWYNDVGDVDSTSSEI
ncbi:CAAX farnesyltransferase (FTase) subunit beta [Arthrobotrys musiformis]|uniref:Protein farnesyltransferase subunit beta n=1 Tax=Arthrobotrys musiformis TaxID=47236 RepID=A0AAV9WAU4_9PEZI